MTKRHFSLIELLIVVGILGALAGLLLPSFVGAEKESKASAALAEMKMIQKSFVLFASDVNFRAEVSGITYTNEKLLDIANYGLWPLLVDSHPNSVLIYDDYDSDTEIGRRSPYLSYDNFVTIDTTSFGTNNYGQEQTDASNGVDIPVIADPYGGYYRVIYPSSNSGVNGNSLNEYQRLQRMVLVCTGPNKELDTDMSSFNTEYEITSDELVAQGDDTIIRLMPLAGF